MAKSKRAKSQTAVSKRQPSAKRPLTKARRSRKRIALIALCIVLLVVLLAVHKIDEPAPPAAVNRSSAVQTNSYAGWKIYAIPSSNLHFKYPEGWRLLPNTGPKGPLGLTPGTPETELTAPDGMYIDILTDNDRTMPEPGNALLLAQRIQSLGSTYYLDYIDAVGDGKVSYATMLASPNASAPYPTVKMPDGTHSRLIASIAYRVTSGPDEKSLGTYQKDPAMQTAKLVLASLRN